MERKPLGTRASTGETCPESGIWKVAGNPTAVPVLKRNKMPPDNGKEVVWELIQYA